MVGAASATTTTIRASLMPSGVVNLYSEIVTIIVQGFYLCKAKNFSLWVARPCSLAIQLPLLHTHTFKGKRIDKVK